MQREGVEIYTEVFELDPIPFDLERLRKNYKKEDVSTPFKPVFRRKNHLRKRLQNSSSDEDGFYQVWVQSSGRRNRVDILLAPPNTSKSETLIENVEVSDLSEYVPRESRKRLLISFL